MKQTIQMAVRREVLSLLTGIGYATVPDWYDATFRSLKMDLVIPKHRAPGNQRPCLLFFCGGAYTTVNGSVWMPELMYFAERGFIVATAEYRTSNQARFPAALIDAKAAVRFLKAHAEAFCIDPEKIFVAGESAGGTLCAMVGVTGDTRNYEQGDYLDQDSRVAGVIDFYGLVDLLAVKEFMANAGGNMQATTNNGSVDSWMLDAFLGPDYSDETARSASAINYVNENTPPFMILHGTADRLVDIVSQSDAFYERLTDAGCRVEYYRLEGIDHGDDAFYQPEVKERILTFMKSI